MTCYEQFDVIVVAFCMGFIGWIAGALTVMVVCLGGRRGEAVE